MPAVDTPSVTSSCAPCCSACPDAYDPAQSARLSWQVTAALAGTQHVRISKDGGRRYSARNTVSLPAEPPGQPATIPVFTPGTGSGQLLALDLDQARVAVTPSCNTMAPPRCDGQALALGQLLDRLGVRYLSDDAPSGGRHVYILFSSPLPWLELRDLCRAIALRFPAADPAPMASLSGQISPPGSRHKSGGWRLLSMPLKSAAAAVGHPNGPEAWAALLDEFAAELQGLESRTAGAPSEAEAEVDDTGVPWVPRLGGRAPLTAELDRVARTGRSPGRGRSEARMAVLASAAARGWRLADVLEAVSSGAWKGFPGLYHRASEPGRMDRLLPGEWKKAIGFVTVQKTNVSWLTSTAVHAPGAAADAVAEFGFIRQWATGISCAAADPDRIRGWGRRSVAIRQLLAAIGQAAMVSGSRVLEHGTRNLSLHSGLSQRTVSRTLRFLYAEPDPLLDLVTQGRQARADRLGLRIPDRYADSVRWRRRRAGRIDGVHPAFLVLGGVAFLVYQVLDGSGARGAEVARAARLSPSATSAALRVLAEHGLAERGCGGWKRGPVSLDEVATSTGSADVHRERAGRYEQDRADWQTRLAQYQAARHRPVNERDGWLSLDDPGEYDFMACRWPVLDDDLVRGPPAAGEIRHTVA